MTKEENTFSLTPLRYWYGSLIAEHTPEPEVRRRMNRALQTVQEEASEPSADALQLDLAALARKQLLAEPSDAQKIAVLVELRAMNPFQPHTIHFSERQALSALKRIIKACEVPLDDVNMLEKFWKEANKGFEHKNPWLLARRIAGATLVAAAALVVLVTSMGSAAPALTALLATLGGGSIATGGFGMLGGVIVLLMGGTTGGALIAMEGKILRLLGPDGLRAELIKLEVTQRLWWREGISGVLKRSEVIGQQRQLLANIKTLLEKEKTISDRKSQAVESWQKMHELVEKSIKRFESLP